MAFDLSKVNKIITTDDNGIVISFINDDSIADFLQTLQTLEYGQTYLFISNTVPNELCTDGTGVTTTT